MCIAWSTHVPVENQTRNGSCGMTDHVIMNANKSLVKCHREPECRETLRLVNAIALPHRLAPLEQAHSAYIPYPRNSLSLSLFHNCLFPIFFRSLYLPFILIPCRLLLVQSHVSDSCFQQYVVPISHCEVVLFTPNRYTLRHPRSKAEAFRSRLTMCQ